MKIWVLQTLVLAAIVIAAALLVESNAQQAAQTNYENQIAGCERNNPRWEAYTAAVVVASETTSDPAAAREYAAQVRSITSQPFVYEDGTTDCRGAIDQP